MLSLQKPPVVPCRRFFVAGVQASAAHARGRASSAGRRGGCGRRNRAGRRARYCRRSRNPPRRASRSASGSGSRKAPAASSGWRCRSAPPPRARRSRHRAWPASRIAVAARPFGARACARLAVELALVGRPAARQIEPGTALPITALRLTPMSAAISRQDSAGLEVLFQKFDAFVGPGRRKSVQRTGMCNGPRLQMSAIRLRDPSASRSARVRPAIVADRQKPVLDGETDAFLDQCPRDAGNAGAVGALVSPVFRDR